MKIIVLIGLLFVAEASEAFPCGRRDEGGDDASFFAPELSKTISIGMLVEENSKLFYISKKPWEPVKLEVSKDKCEGYDDYKKNEIVLLTSEKSIQELQGQKINLKTAWVRSLDDISVFAEKASKQRDELPQGEPNIFWKYCSSDFFCTKVKSFCGSTVGLNEKYQTRYENYLKSHQDKVKCEKIKVDEKKKSQCINNFCT